jgi:hypothetical protein
MERERLKQRPCESLSTDARHRDGWSRSSAEGAVMALERRGPVIQLNLNINHVIGRNV